MAENTTEPIEVPEHTEPAETPEAVEPTETPETVEATDAVNTAEAAGLSEAAGDASRRDATAAADDGAAVGRVTEVLLSTHPAPALPASRRKPTLDQKLAHAKDFALSALKELVAEDEIGDGHRVAADDERLLTHYFTSTKRGYRDWEWYVTLARAPRQTVPTVCESGITPAQGALLAPEWVPWSERLSDDEKDDADQDERGEDTAAGAPAGEGDSSVAGETEESTESTDNTPVDHTGRADSDSTPDSPESGTHVAADADIPDSASPDSDIPGQDTADAGTTGQAAAEQETADSDAADQDVAGQDSAGHHAGEDRG